MNDPNMVKTVDMFKIYYTPDNILLEGYENFNPPGYYIWEYETKNRAGYYPKSEILNHPAVYIFLKGKTLTEHMLREFYE